MKTNKLILIAALVLVTPAYMPLAHADDDSAYSATESADTETEYGSEESYESDASMDTETYPEIEGDVEADINYSDEAEGQWKEPVGMEEDAALSEGEQSKDAKNLLAKKKADEAAKKLKHKK